MDIGQSSSEIAPFTSVQWKSSSQDLEYQITSVN